MNCGGEECVLYEVKVCELQERELRGDSYLFSATYREGLVAVARGVELGAVEQRAHVVALDLHARGRDLASAVLGWTRNHTPRGREGEGT